MCILLNVKKHEKTFALNVDIFTFRVIVKKCLRGVEMCDKIFLRGILINILAHSC